MFKHFEVLGYWVVYGLELMGCLHRGCLDTRARSLLAEAVA